MVLLARSTISSIELNFKICCTGPKIYSKQEGNHQRCATAKILFHVYLFSGDGHVIFDVSKHGRLDEITAVSVSLTASEKFGTFSLTGVDKCQDLFELIFVHLRSLFDVQIERIAHISLFGTFHAPLDKFVINRVFHKNARSGATAGKRKKRLSSHNSK